MFLNLEDDNTFVKLKDGTYECISDERDVADVVERYCGSDLANVIRNSNHNRIVSTAVEVCNNLNEASDCNDLQQLLCIVDKLFVTLWEVLRE